MSVITIDGNAGVGKTSISNYIEENSSFYSLSSGNIYRAIVYALAPEWEDEHQANQVFSTWTEQEIINYIKNALYLVETINLKVVTNDRIFLEIIDLDGPLLLADTKERKMNNSSASKIVAIASKHPELRQFVNQAILNLSKSVDLIVDGRDMATLFENHPNTFKVKVTRSNASKEETERNKIDNHKISKNFDLIVENDSTIEKAAKTILKKSDHFFHNKPSSFSKPAQIR